MWAYVMKFIILMASQGSWSRLEGKDVQFFQILEVMQNKWWLWMLIWISEGCLCIKVKIPLCLQWAVMALLTQLWQAAISVLCYFAWEFNKLGVIADVLGYLGLPQEHLVGVSSVWGKQRRGSIEQYINASIMCCRSTAHGVRYKWPPDPSGMAMRP